MEGTPTDVFADTAKEFGYEDYADRFDVVNNQFTSRMEADAYRRSGRQRAFGNLLDLGTAYALRG